MRRFGELIQKYRIDADQTLDSVADVLGVSPAYLSEVELGRKPPLRRSRIEKLAKLYGVDSETLLEEACRECGFVEIDTRRVSSLQMKIIFGLIGGALSEDQWAEIWRVLNRESRDARKASTGVSQLASAAKAAS